MITRAATWKLARSKNTVAFALIAFVFSLGCVPNHSPEGETAYKINSILEVVIRLSERGSDVKTYKSLSEILADARRKGIVSEAEIRAYSTDSWGRPFKWEIRKSGNNAVARILSAGRNGIFENGGGDDVTLECAIPLQVSDTPRIGKEKESEKRTQLDSRIELRPSMKP